MRIAIRFALFLSVPLMLLCGCVSSKPLLRSYEASATPVEILANNASQVPEGAIVMRRARVRIESPGRSFSTGLVVWVGSSHQLRIEILSLLGLPDLVLTANGRSIKVCDLRENRFYAGSADRDFSRFLPVNLTATEAVSLMLGLSPPVDLEEGLRGDRMSEQIRVDYRLAGITKRSLWFDAASREMRRQDCYDPASGETIYSAVFEHYGDVNGYRFPGTVTVRFERPEQVTMTLRFSSVKIEQESAIAFDQEPPAGISTTDLK